MVSCLSRVTLVEKRKLTLQPYFHRWIYSIDNLENRETVRFSLTIIVAPKFLIVTSLLQSTGHLYSKFINIGRITLNSTKHLLWPLTTPMTSVKRYGSETCEPQSDRRTEISGTSIWTCVCICLCVCVGYICCSISVQNKTPKSTEAALLYHKICLCYEFCFIFSVGFAARSSETNFHLPKGTISYIYQ